MSYHLFIYIIFFFEYWWESVFLFTFFYLYIYSWLLSRGFYLSVTLEKDNLFYKSLIGSLFIHLTIKISFDLKSYSFFCFLGGSSEFVARICFETLLIELNYKTYFDIHVKLLWFLRFCVLRGEVILCVKYILKTSREHSVKLSSQVRFLYIVYINF